MQERKNKRLAILFVALCCMALLVFYLGTDGGSIAVDKNTFKNFDLKSVQQIVMESKKSRVALKFNGAKWIVNNQFDADPAMIEVLFATLQQAEPKRLLATSLQDSVGNALKQEGVKISLFESGELTTSFYAGGNAQKSQAYFATDETDRKTYLVTIPGYRVYVSGIFELEEKDWKNKYVFGFNWRNFNRLEASFPGNDRQNFAIAMNENYFAVEGMGVVDTTKLNDFLDDVSLLTVEEYIDDPFMDSIPKPSPVMIINVKDIAQRMYTLEIYRPAKNHIPRVPGLINGVHWAFFDPERIQTLFKGRDFFGK